MVSLTKGFSYLTTFSQSRRRQAAARVCSHTVFLNPTVVTEPSIAEWLLTLHFSTLYFRCPKWQQGFSQREQSPPKWGTHVRPPLLQGTEEIGLALSFSYIQAHTHMSHMRMCIHTYMHRYNIFVLFHYRNFCFHFPQEEILMGDLEQFHWRNAFKVCIGRELI